MKKRIMGTIAAILGAVSLLAGCGDKGVETSARANTPEGQADVQADVEISSNVVDNVAAPEAEVKAVTLAEAGFCERERVIYKINPNTEQVSEIRVISPNGDGTFDYFHLILINTHNTVLWEATKDDLPTYEEVIVKIEEEKADPPADPMERLVKSSNENLTSYPPNSGCDLFDQHETINGVEYLVGNNGRNYVEVTEDLKGIECLVRE